MDSVNLIMDQTIPSGSLKSIVFDLMTNGDIEKLCEVSIIEANDVTSAKLGLPHASSQCGTCGSRNLKDCDGHYGFVKLPKVIYHPFFVTEIVHILNQICPGCKCVKKDLQMKDSLILEASEKAIGENIYILEALGKNLTSLQRKLLKLCRSKLLLPSQGLLARNTKIRFINLKKCLKIRKNWVAKDSEASCKFCARKFDKWYPSVKFKISSRDMLGRRSLSIIAEVNEKLPKKFHGKSLSEVLPEDYWNFIPNVSLQQGPRPIKIDLTPHQVFCLLKELDPEFIQQFVSKREVLFLSCLPITPNCHRVVETSRVFADGPKFSFDNRTKSYRRLVDVSRKIGEFRHHQQFGPLATSYTTSRVLDCWNGSKLRAANSSNGDSSGISGLRWIKDVLLSKRSDNAFRMTMVGDPMIKLHEIGIPRDISAKLIVAEHVNAYNFEKLNMLCNAYLLCNLHLLTEEVLCIRRKEEVTGLHKINQLQVGDILYRPLQNGDIILVNRPPSVHQHSLIALSALILPIQSVISINPLCCAPLLGDFDGDCLHGYVPQSIGCRVELQELVSLDHQLFNAQDGRSLVSLTHDSLTAAYLLTAKREFFTKFDMQQLAMLCPSPLPPPAIVNAPKLHTPLWTGDQLFGMLLPPMDFGADSGNILISKGEIMSSPGVSFWLRNTTASMFFTMFKCYGRKALDYLNCAQELLCEYLSLRGLSVSLNDVYLSSDSYSHRKMKDEIYYGLEEAEVACRVKELMLDPKMQDFLKCRNEDEDTINCISQYGIASTRTCATQISIAAFKDVYQELISVVHHFIDKDNSMLAMINAGSKGNLLKLIQQGACLALQLFAHPLPLRIPHKHNCNLWNHHKALSCSVPDASKSLYGRSSYAVVSASFLDGLNPLECFLHAISGRANLFSANAELPGTLTRKLMFYMRDLYVSYDGTVRNAHGQQIIEFSYSSFEDSTGGGNNKEAYDDKDAECSGLGGQPVGSWAACSISEAAYGALDFPINCLEDSPLMKLKTLLECCKANASMDHAVLLFLTKRLQGWRYGFEYGALEIKNHLESVFFSDLVTTVMINYDGHDVQGANISPWTMHFHVNKDRMLRKRLNLPFVKDKLKKYYNCRREKMDMIFPRLHFVNKKCSSINEQMEHDETFCITVAAETSEFQVQLETIRDGVIPLLLKTLVKGFWASEKVEILCESFCGSDAELFLKVTMSKMCLPGKFWNALLSACIPIMDLIDWGRSHPNNTFNVCSTFGVDAAWEYFVNSLKSVTAATGREVLKGHLFLTADCLSVTGEFHGLSTKGLRQQRDDMSISTPFTQACLSNPVNSFVNAAKQGSVDHLYGTLDAVAWGKEAPIGTGGPFEIVYSGKVPNLNRSESIYKKLHNLENEMALKQTISANCNQQAKYFSCAMGVESTGPLTSEEGHLKERIFSKNTRTNCNVHSKWQQNSACGVHAKTCGVRSKSAIESSSSLTDVVDMYISLRTVLHKYSFDGYLDEKDKSLLIEALNYHPKRDAKIGSGIQDIKVGYSPSHPGSRCFVLVKLDGTLEDFSYRKCVIGAANLVSPEFGSFVHKKLYHGR